MHAEPHPRRFLATLANLAEFGGARSAPHQNCHRARGNPRFSAARDLSSREYLHALKPNLFAKRTRSLAKHLVRLASLSSRVLISRNFANSRNWFRRAGSRATLRVEQTEMERRRLPQGDGARRRRGARQEVHVRQYMPGQPNLTIPVVTPFVALSGAKDLAFASQSSAEVGARSFAPRRMTEHLA
jgi:hypothetical protein